MESITTWLQSTMLKPVPVVDLAPLPGKLKGKLRLTPEQLLLAIHAQELAAWSLQASVHFRPIKLKKGPGGRSAKYRDSSILLMVIVQTVWRKSYEQIVDDVAIHSELAKALGFEGRTISQGQYWERRSQLGVLPFVFFFLALATQLIRCELFSFSPPAQHVKTLTLACPRMDLVRLWTLPITTPWPEDWWEENRPPDVYGVILNGTDG